MTTTQPKAGTAKTIENTKAEIRAKLKPAEPAKAEAKPVEAPKVDVTVAPEPIVSEVKPVESTVAAVSPKDSDIEPAKIENGQLILTAKHLELIKTQIAKRATPEEFDLFIMMARRTRLDPLLKQLYFMKYKNRRASEQAGCRCYGDCTCGKAVYDPATYVTSIDGYRIIAHRTNDFAGIDEPIYTRATPTGLPTHCTVKVYRKSSERAFSATVKFSEYTTGKNMWASMPETMIAKVAEAHALRKAFPQDLSGIYTTDEMEQADRGQAIATDTKRQIAAPAPAPVKMMTNGQWQLIKALAMRKGGEGWEAKLKALVAKVFSVDSMRKISNDQAEKLVDILTRLTDSKPKPEPVPTPEDAEAIFTADQPTKSAPTQMAMPGDDQYVDPDDIPDDLGVSN